MSTPAGKTSTGVSSQSPSKLWYAYVFAWLGIWWPIVALGIVFTAAGIFKYFLPQKNLYPVMVDLIKAISVLMVAIYVIYTRILSLETKKMAAASMGLYISEKGTVLTELAEDVCDYEALPMKAQEVARAIHVEDKKMSDEEFTALVSNTNLPSIILKIKNMSGRRIEASTIEYKVRHTGTDRSHGVICDVSKVGTINPWGDKVVVLMVAPEGEIEVTVNIIDYLDGGVVQRVGMAKKMIMERIRKPEKQ